MSHVVGDVGRTPILQDHPQAERLIRDFFAEHVTASTVLVQHRVSDYEPARAKVRVKIGDDSTQFDYVLGGDQPETEGTLRNTCALCLEPCEVWKAPRTAWKGDVAPPMRGAS